MKLIRIQVISLLSLILLGCSSYNIQKETDAVKSVMEQQAECWSSGNLEGYMEGYWKSDSLRFLGSRGLTHGWEQTLSNYKKGYPTTDAMGKLRFSYISFEPIGRKHMFVVGRWTLERQLDTLGGYYSLLWRKIDGEWRIVFDHTN